MSDGRQRMRWRGEGRRMNVGRQKMRWRDYFKRYTRALQLREDEAPDRTGHEGEGTLERPTLHSRGNKQEERK